MSKPKKVVKKSKPVTKPKKKVPAKKRRETVKIPRALNKQIAESVATAGEPGPAHDCGPEWDGFYEWIKPLSRNALILGISEEVAAVDGGLMGPPVDKSTTDAQLRAELVKAAKMRHDAGVPYEWPEDVHEYYPEPPAADGSVPRASGGYVIHPPHKPMSAEETAAAWQASEEGRLLDARNSAEEIDLCKDPGDGELDTLAHIITDLGYAMRAARFIRRRIKEGVDLPASPAFLLREALRALAKANDSLNGVVLMVREEKPAGNKN